MTGFGVGVEVRTDDPPFNYVSESKLMWQEDDGWNEGTELKKGLPADRIFSLTSPRPGESLKRRRRGERGGREGGSV